MGVALCAVLPYLNGLRNGFTFDDVAIVAENRRIRSIGGLGEVVTTDWWNGKRPQSLLYRPLTMASFALDYAVARRGETGPPPARLPASAASVFHLQNVLWHGAVSAVLFLLVLELFASPGLALATAALFAVHPVHTEAVDGIVGRAELLSAFFAFLALLVAGRVIRDDPPGASRPAMSGIFVLLALLSKEQAIVIPLVPLLWLYLRRPEERRDLIHRRSFRRLLVSLGCASLVYLGVRTAVLGTPVGAAPIEHGGIVVDNPLASASGVARMLTPVRIFGHALGLLVFPRTLSADYSYDQIKVVASLDGATFLCGLAVCGLAGGAWFFRRREPAASFGILFLFLTWALASNIFVLIGTIFGERLLYLPSAGACLSIASVLLALGRRSRGPWVAAAAVAALVVAGGARTRARNVDWKDNATLFKSAALTSPRSCKALDGYASELFTAGRSAEAVRWAERALAVYPLYPSAHQTLSKALRVLANSDRDPTRRNELRKQAAAHSLQVIQILSSASGNGGGLADAWNVLGSLDLDGGNLNEAVEDFRKSLLSMPDYVPSLIGVGVAQVMRADRESDPQVGRDLRDAAVRYFEQAVAIDPASLEARQNAAFTLRTLGSGSADGGRRAELLRRAEAHEAFAFAAHRDAGEVDALANLHGVRGSWFLKERSYAEALTEFREAARLQPRAARSYDGIGTVLAARAEEEPDSSRRLAEAGEAIQSFERALELEPDYAPAHLNLAIVYLRQKRDPSMAAEHFRSYLRLVPDAPQRTQIEETIRQIEARPTPQ
jgi:tetratricopeptide (TPR) repeat protein